MFNDEYGLTEAVLSGVKTMTRRIVKAPSKFNGVDDPWMKFHKRPGSKNRYDCMLYDHDGYELGPLPSRYKVGEEVAVAQRYSDIPMQYLLQAAEDPLTKYFHRRLISESQGYKNKMFVRAELMPHRIRITNLWYERLQDISDVDCADEGIVLTTWRQFHAQDWDDFSPQRYTDHHVWTLPKFLDGIENPWAEGDPNEFMADTAKTAFAVLIMKMYGKKVWNANPWVAVYSFNRVMKATKKQ